MKELTRKLKAGVHNVRVGGKMRKVRVLKTGQWRFMKGGATKSRRTRRAKPSKRRRRTIPRRRRRRRASKKIPLAATAGVVGSFARPIGTLLSGGSPEFAMYQFVEGMTGYYPPNQSFDISRLRFGLLPILMGCGVSMLASKFGLNRYLRHVPFVKI